MIRLLITSILEGALKRINGTSARGALSDREMFQHYGFTSRPKPGAEAIVVRDGNIFISVADDDRRYRLAVAEGEVALYTDEGDKVHFKRGRVLEITAGIKLKINAPLTEVDGNLVVSGNVSDSGGSMAAMRTTYDGHTHIETGGETNTTLAQM